jgi:hypothetical protein
LSPLPGPRAQLGSDALSYWLSSESECGVFVRTCVCSRCFTRPPGPRLAALPENRPRRNQVAPVCGHSVARSQPGRSPVSTRRFSASSVCR